MKWLLIKLLTWFHRRKWSQQYQLVLASTDSVFLTCEILAKCLEAFNPFLVKGVPREQYIEVQVVTSTSNVVDLQKWLTGYIATLKSYNIYQAKLAEDGNYERPDSSYMGTYGVELSEPLSINLHDYMKVQSNEYTHVTLLNILDSVKEASAELQLIEDEIDYDYFVRRAAYTVNDVWALLSIFIKVNKLYEI